MSQVMHWGDFCTNEVIEIVMKACSHFVKMIWQCYYVIDKLRHQVNLKCIRTNNFVELILVAERNISIVSFR